MAKQPTTPNVATSRKKPPTKIVKTRAGEPRQTKRARIIDLLNQPDGATIDQIVSATAWLPHTARAALTGLRKSGLTIESDKVGDERRYRIVDTESAS